MSISVVGWKGPFIIPRVPSHPLGQPYQRAAFQPRAALPSSNHRGVAHAAMEVFLALNGLSFTWTSTKRKHCSSSSPAAGRAAPGSQPAWTSIQRFRARLTLDPIEQPPADR